jgi:hypothetical protein
MSAYDPKRTSVVTTGILERGLINGQPNADAPPNVLYWGKADMVIASPLLTPSEHSALAPYFSVFLSLASVEQGLSFEQASPITPID